MAQKKFNSLEKAIDILDLYDIDKREYSAKEISEKLGIPLSSVYKYLEFLIKRQLLRRKPRTKLYGLGFMIARLGYVMDKDMEVLEVIRPHLEALCQETGETAFLTMLTGEEVLTLDPVEPQRLVKFTIEPGRRLPLSTGATSKILLANKDEEFIEQYLADTSLRRLTEKTIVDADVLRGDLAQIKKQGYAISDSEVDVGARAVSVPLFDQNGRIFAGLSVAGPSERVTGEMTRQLIVLLKKRAAMIENGLRLALGV
ncbi:MAG: hypothetical protein CSA21_00920 [Deltaproteobacteria bacterium]|nr:MAG: hypothetical protein CSA21_00920 [Deltaproteobacteria bacterium]